MELSEKELTDHPFLKQGLSQIKILQGNLHKAHELVEWIRSDGPYQLNARLMTPDISYKDMYEIALRLKAENWVLDNYVITAGRPSILNGAWDLSPCSELILSKSPQVSETVEILFPRQKQVILELLEAEALYWRDDCYKALVIISSKIPILREAADMRFLFAALTLQIYILVINGQAVSVEALTDSLRHQLKSSELEAYLPNIDALEAWMAMFDHDYVKVTNWMRDGAPDEYSGFCMLDTFRYMVKMRAYIIQGKYLAVTSLCQNLLPILQEGNRHMDLCELHIIRAMSDHADGREMEALEHVEQALKLAETYRYDRLFADEGQRIYKLLKLYRKKRMKGAKNAYLDRLIEMTEKTAALHPRYLKNQLPKQPALTATEMWVLRLLADYKTNAEISEIAGMAEETARKHCKHIIAKLEVHNRHQAVDRAIEMGLIEPKKLPK